jgi:hypothetical protein
MSRIPEDVQDLLRTQITSYEELETLLLLRAGRHSSWTAEALADALAVRSEDAEDALARMRDHGLVEVTANRYSYAASTLDETIGRLEHAYKECRLEVMKLMNENSVERVRSAAARALADAFVVRKRRKDG